MLNNKSCILRLSKYKKTLKRLKVLGFKKVFSDNLADAIGVSSAQVRKDFSMFDITGNKKAGYTIDDLIERLNCVLGRDEYQNVIIIGAGSIGSALIKYQGFDKEGIKILAAFDTDERKVARDNAVPILPAEELKSFVKNNNITIGIICVPDLYAQQTVELMIDAGIKGALNFAPVNLRVPSDFVIESINLEMELEAVIYFVNALDNDKRKISIL